MDVSAGRRAAAPVRVGGRPAAGGRRAAALVGALAAGLAANAAARAEALRLELDPSTTQVRFSLEATLHTVEGVLRLTSGEIAFDDRGGPASGRIVLDARSARTGIASRDANMHEQVLESERYPEIVFLPERIEVEREGADRGRVRLAGSVEIHGGRHALVVPARVVRRDGNLWIRAEFEVPYVDWGLEDPSTFVLRVAKVVTVEVEALARIRPASEPAAPPSP